jgi:hypothetical protein
MKFAYADPPYIGQAKRHYGEQAREVNHRLLIQHLVDDYPDGWALSLSTPTLRDILPLCPDDVRVCAWVKPFCAWKDRNVAYAWEPVILRGGRKRARTEETSRDWVSANARLVGGVHGSKPEKFSWWLFSVWNAKPGDELDDLFVGSGAVTKAWAQWTREPRQTVLAL